ncbi:asparagine synthetase B family protein [Sulfurovum riftiae]|uniref:asparagine synthetase B family protein n=1 Tax=Sulfurovum riftiae TaxID=1630136 RepID=UPI0008295AB0|nr:asparagine synthase-related protein [Sulfurovum riftiae]
MQFYGIYYLADKSKNDFNFSADASIYNQTELIKTLQIDNYTKNEKNFETFILKSYEKWQEASPEYLVGDFSFALYDKEKEQLFCARDHLGIRPFYYYHSKDLFAFSSDLDMLFSLTDIPKKPNIASMRSLAEHRSIDHDKTMYENIKRLPPGHSLTLKKDGILHIERYWKPELIKPDESITLQDAAQQFNTLFAEAVRCRLPAEDTVGCELSGGLDSSSVCSVAHRLTNGNIAAFSMRFGEYGCDEGPYIKAVAENLNITPTEVSIDKVDFKNEYNMDFNYRVGPHWPVFLTYTQLFPVAKAVHERNIKVVLTGQGGDHIMSGSRRMIMDYLKTYQWKNFFRELSALGFTKKNIKNYLLIPLLNKKQKDIIKSILEKLHLREPTINTGLQKQPSPYNDTDTFYSEAFEHDVTILNDAGFSTVFDSSAYHAARKLYGIEYRHPFFDIRLVEFMLSLPAEFKYSQNTIKVLLREAMKGVLPETVRERKDKAEFSETIKDQLDAIDVEALFGNASIVDLGIVSEEKLDTYLTQYGDNALSHTISFWTLVNLEIWLKKIKTEERQNFSLLH